MARFKYVHVSSIFCTVALSLTAGSSALADVPSALEPAYSEAVLAYNSKEYPKAVALLDGLIAKDPKVYEFLELKALVLKTMKDPARASEVYQSLIKSKMAQSRPEREIAPYHFELGGIYLEKSDFARARDSYVYAIRSNFNTSPSQFFLGTVYYRTKTWAAADNAFREVLRGDVEDLKPSAHFYIGQIALQTGNAGSATQSFHAAKSSAKEQIDGKETGPETRRMAQSVYDQADASLKPFSQSKYFGNVTLITAYDSNVLSVPSSQASTGSGTGQGSVKETLQLGLGYMTSPMNTFQWVPSYRGSYNYNFNRGVRSGQYMTHDLSVYITRNALSPTSWGMKVSGNYTFQTEVDPATDKGTLKPYSLAASVGPYAKREIAKKTILGGEVYAQPTKNYLDADLDSEVYHRSGFDLVGKVYIKNDRGDRWWNPGAAVSFDINSTKGAEYKSKGFTFGLHNGLRLSDATNLNLAIDYSPVSYSERPSQSRTDKMLSLDANLSHQFSEKYSLVGDIQFINNSSNITDIYQYKRLVVSAGLGYSL